MRSILTVKLALFLCILSIGRSEIPDGCLLRGIRQVESHDNPTKTGARGERGTYQFRLKTWCDRTSEPFSRAYDPLVADQVASDHLAWLRLALEEQGVVDPSPWLLAAAWNAGATAAAGGRISRATQDYADRVISLAEIYASDLPLGSRADKTRFTPPRFSMDPLTLIFAVR